MAVNTVEVVVPDVHIVGLVATALTLGLSTVTVTVFVAVQPFASVVLMVYAWVDPGVAVGFDTVLELSPALGVHT